MVKKSTSVGIEMTGEIAMANRSPRRVQIHDNNELGYDSNHANSSIIGPTGQSVDLSVSSSFYGGGVTITGGGPDETFKDEFGNECSRYTNRTIIVNEHMATADEMRNHNGMDIPTKGGYGTTFQKRMIAFAFVASTIVLLLVLLLDIGKSDDTSGNREDKLAAVMGATLGDDWDDDDSAWDEFTHSALGDD